MHTLSSVSKWDIRGKSIAKKDRGRSILECWDCMVLNVVDTALRFRISDAEEGRGEWCYSGAVVSWLYLTYI